MRGKSEILGLDILPESKWEEDEDDLYICTVPEDEMPEVGFVF